MPDAENDAPRNVHAYADQLRQYATHFEMRDWDYTRNHDIRALYYLGPWGRFTDALGFVWRGFFKRDSLGKSLGLKVGRWRTFKAHLRYHNHLPDGVLDGGSIITHWEETGEYLQYVQPSVGAMLADWMDAEPESPHAQRIAAEMKRINDRYGQRIKADETAPIPPEEQHNHDAIGVYGNCPACGTVLPPGWNPIPPEGGYTAEDF